MSESTDALTIVGERLGKYDQASPDGTHTNPNITTLISGVKELEKMKARRSGGPLAGLSSVQVKPSGVM